MKAVATNFLINSEMDLPNPENKIPGVWLTFTQLSEFFTPGGEL